MDSIIIIAVRRKGRISLQKGPVRKKFWWTACAVLLVAAAGGIFWWQSNEETEAPVALREEVVTRGDIIASLSEEGTASVTTQTTGLDLSVTLDGDTHLDLDVKVEDVLVRAGERVSQGDALFILDQSSLNKAMNTLNNAYQEAQLKADDAALSLELGTASAEQARTESLSDGSVAAGVYENTLAEMENKLAQYEKNLREGQEDYETYTELLELYNVRTATRNNMKSLVDHYEDALEALQDFYEDYNDTNADYKAAYNNYKNQLSALTETLERAEAEKDAYADSDEAERYGDAYDTAVDQFNKAIEMINQYQSVVDAYDTLENRIEDAEDCLKEAQEAYDAYNEDYQDWYGNTTYSELQRKVSQLQLDLETTQLTYDEYKLLYESNKEMAASDRDKTVVSAETADLTYQSTVNKLQQEVVSTQLTASNLYAYVQELNSCLQDNVIVSPCDGLITNIAFEAGDKIDLTQDVVTIAQNDSISVVLSIDQDDIANVSLDQQALVTFDASEQTFEGWVDAISVSPRMVGAPTVNYTVTVVVEGEGLEDIYEGMSCAVELVSERVNDVLVIPKRAITTEGRQSYVQLKQADGTAVQQPVTLGFTDGTNYEVKEGLSEGDVVLIGSSVNSSSNTSNTSNERGSHMDGNMSGMPDGAGSGSDMAGGPGAGTAGGEGGMRGGTGGNSAAGVD